ncbi:MAG: hypothetical protein ISQ58_11590, partial [Pseudomonadales bacterium]|nr:hypothetical protein [Pseudomonadales bacterium]
MLRTLLLLASILTPCLPVLAQRALPDLNDIAGEFAFVRIQYDSYYGGGFYG